MSTVTASCGPTALFAGVNLDVDTDGGRAQLRVERLVRVCLAGGVAARRYARDLCRGTDHDDVSKAVNLLAKIVGSDAELRAYVQLLEIQTQQLVRHVWWPEIRAVAKALPENRTLSGPRAREIIRLAGGWTVGT